MGLYGALLLWQNGRLVRRGLTMNESLGYAKWVAARELAVHRVVDCVV
jgi:hypothetical protein